jgi:hypothetical protein
MRTYLYNRFPSDRQGRKEGGREERNPESNSTGQTNAVHLTKFHAINALSLEIKLEDGDSGA